MTLNVGGYHWEAWNVPELECEFWCAGLFPDDKGDVRGPSYCSMGFSNPGEAVDFAEPAVRQWLRENDMEVD